MSDASRDELGAFASEIRPLLVSVPAYPPRAVDAEALPSTSRRAASWSLRRLSSAVWRGAGAVAFAPIAVALFAVRVTWWLVSSAIHAVWRGVSATFALVIAAIVALAVLVRRAVDGVIGLCAAAARRGVRAVSTAAAFTRASIGAAGHACMSAVHSVRRLCAAAVGACVRGVSATAAFIAASFVAVGHACLSAFRTAAAGARALAALVRRAVDAAVSLCAAAVGGCIRGASATAAFITASCVAAGHACMVAGRSGRRLCAAAVGGCVRGVSATAAIVTASIVAVGRAGMSAVRTAAAGTRALAVLGRRAVDGVLGLCAAAVRSGVRAVSTAAAFTRTSIVAAGHACMSAGRSGRRLCAAAVGSGVRAVSAAAAFITATFVARAVEVSRALGHAFSARLTSMRVVVSVGPALKASAAPQAWRRRTVLVPALGAVVLASVATAGTVLVISRRPAPRASKVLTQAPAVVSTALAPIVAAAPLAPATIEAVVRPAVSRVKVKEDVRPAANVRPPAAVNAAQVRAIWLKTDTRSLDRALSTVRQATLAFRSCSVQVTATDQAVAHCDLARTGDDGRTSRRDTSWTIGFTRADDRWRIDGITETASGRPRR